MSQAWKVRSGTEEVPDGWELRRVGDLVSLTNGHPFPSDTFGPTGDVPLVRIRDLGDGPFETFVTGSVPPSVLLRDGDVVIGMDGDFNLVLWNKGRAALNQRLCLLRPRGGVDIRFVAYALPAALKIINDLTFSTTVKHLSSSDVLSERIMLPPLEEQRRIADFLDAETGRIDGLTGMRRRQIDKVAERYSAFLSELVVPGAGAPGARHPLWPWLPASVATARLGYLARVQTGVTVHGARDRSSDDAEYPYLRVANVQGEWLDLSEIKTITIPVAMARRSTLRPGDVVMTEANGNPDNLGRGAVWTGEIAGMVHQNHVFAIRADRRRLIPDYLSALLASSHGRTYFRFTSTQVGIATTSSSKVLDFPVPTLDLRRQREVVKEYEANRATTRQATDALVRQLDLLAERRQALVTAAVTGRLDVSSASGRGAAQ
ncbi:restriction endonuclease subunit S [Kitasatospora sp. RG8]|uniref:restriction endonuclease subunit S n=1 Tax=Kitasatospora sp. RG8 TaxID=2820815 RepID=UPI001ADEE761|nr:restriction endonuclease subunit S [Kitasatospora sp. RG8]MBP0453535.1 restriction endonuclease subunit S [Kitasatospora sp. RG8]